VTVLADCHRNDPQSFTQRTFSQRLWGFRDPLGLDPHNGPRRHGTASGRSVAFHSRDQPRLSILAWPRFMHSRKRPWAHRFRTEGAAAILTAWRDRDILMGRRVEIRGTGEPFMGRVVGLDEGGRLIVRSLLGERRMVTTEAICACD
jgi:hypothetical protein